MRLSMKIFLIFLLIVLVILFLIIVKHVHRKIENQKLVLIGLDGATFDIILPMVEEGKLPNFARLLKNSAWGNSTSIPPDSAIQWTSIITGVEPKKHGIHDFGYKENGNFVLYNITAIKTPPLWRILSMDEKRVGVVDWLFSWPTEKVNGFMVLGGRFFSKLVYYPPNLNLSNFNTNLALNLTKDESINDLISFEKYKQKLTLDLIKKYDVNFLAYVSYLPDDLQHNYWSYMEPSYFDVEKDEVEKYGNTIESGYELLDNFIGNFINENITLVITSDHGFHRGDIVGGPVLVNNLTLVKSYKHIIFRMNYLLNKTGYLYFDDRYETIDFSRTKAYFCNNFTFVGICINSNTNEEKEKIALNIVEMLNKLEFENREKLFTSVKIIESYDKQPTIIFKFHPNLLIETNFFYNNSAKISHIFDDPSDIEYVAINNSKVRKILLQNLTFELNELIDFSERLGGAGRHAKNGIIIIYGNNIKKGIFTGAEPIDLAPTILYLMNESIPENMDGRVLTDAIKGYYLQNDPIRYTTVKKYEPIIETNITIKKEKIEERLRELGYIV